MTRTVIPKDCLLCDVCNKQLSDNLFIAIEDSSWYEGWLYCTDCNTKYNPDGFLTLIQRIVKLDDLSKTDLALPMILWG